MSIKTKLISLSILVVTSVVFADLKIADFTIPEKITIDKTNLILNGTGFRKVSVFNVKVWLSALYLEKNETSAKAIVDSATKKVIDLYPMYEVSAADSIKGWKLAFEQNCEPKCEELKTEIADFLKKVPDFKKNDRYRYIFTNLYAQSILNDKEIFSSKNPEFAKLLLRTWIGEKPPTVEVKKGLLTGSAAL